MARWRSTMVVEPNGPLLVIGLALLLGAAIPGGGLILLPFGVLLVWASFSVGRSRKRLKREDGGGGAGGDAPSGSSGGFAGGGGMFGGGGASGGWGDSADGGGGDGGGGD